MIDAPRYFHDLPEAALEVRSVKPWREATASVAFYNSPAPDGSRPGIYYVNLSDMTQVLKPQIEAISYHEGAPGQQLPDRLCAGDRGHAALPAVRRLRRLCRGLGPVRRAAGQGDRLLSGPYSDFGRLSLELWRAVRLVTDTGLHAKHWSREDAIAYFQRNSLLSERDIVKEVERYITSPGQATSYKIGELKIRELRARAEAALGPRFDLRDYHAVVLGSGSVPLEVLEDQVDAWIAAGGGHPASSPWRGPSPRWRNPGLALALSAYPREWRRRCRS